MPASNKNYLTHLFLDAVDIVKPENCMVEAVQSLDANQELCVVALGKASIKMAEVVYDNLGNLCSGIAVTRKGYALKKSIGNIRVFESSHPVPDKTSEEAAQLLLQTVRDNPKDKPILFLISGGGSALASLPINGVTLEEKIAINRFLLASGAPIHEVNQVRKHLSQIKGNKLALSANSEYETWIISDIVGDDLSLVASGPTVEYKQKILWSSNC